MKIVIIGGTGLIGSKTVERLRKKGHEVLAASPNSGVNTITGEGLAEALAGAQVVIDLANSPSFEDKAVLEFFETSGRNLLAAEKAAGVKHHLALSIVGAERLPKSGYMRAKVAQEKLIRDSGIPYTIVHSTQFFEFLDGIAQSGTVGDRCHSFVRLFPADRLGRRRGCDGRCGALPADQRRDRDRRPRAGPHERSSRALSEGDQ